MEDNCGMVTGECICGVCPERDEEESPLNGPSAAEDIADRKEFFDALEAAYNKLAPKMAPNYKPGYVAQLESKLDYPHEEIAELEATIATQAATIEALKGRLEVVAMAFYDAGYEKGHNDTVESCYSPPSEYPEDFPDIFKDIMPADTGESRDR